MKTDQSNSKIEILIREPMNLLSENIPKYWYNGDPFSTHFMNSLSAFFPAGEAFFVYAVLRYQDKCLEEPELMRRIKGFVGQEYQHSRVHDRHFNILMDQGYTGLKKRVKRTEKLIRWGNTHRPKVSLAITAAAEHLTTLFARRILAKDGAGTKGMHPEMAALWRWHSLEEAEHKAVAFDVLERVGVDRRRLTTTMVFFTGFLLIRVLDRLFYMLWKDGLLFKASTWTSGYRFLWGNNGFLRGMGPDYRAWYRKGFHPNDIDDTPMIESNTKSIESEIGA